MTLLQVISLLLVLAGLFGAVNYLLFKLPAAIGVLIVALLASLSVMGLDLLIPDFAITAQIRNQVEAFEFSSTLLEGMLGLLLFAGALHVKLGDLRAHIWVVALMASLGVVISTLIVGVGFHLLLGLPLVIALVFGALISPTDPVAVLGVLRAADLRKSLETKIAGESLFNDGIGYVVFLILVAVAFPAESHHAITLSDSARLFVQEAAGGAALGGILGFLVFQLMRHIDDYALEVLLSLGLAFGGYQLAVYLHVSGPIMAVVAGLFIGDIGTKYGMSTQTRHYLDKFWELVDEILNAILFLLIGVEVFAIAFDLNAIWAGLIGIVLALLARLGAVTIPIFILKPFRTFGTDVIPMMTWGGIKGGISVALALSLPDSEYKPMILTATYIVVLFSIIVQGLTIAPLANRLGRSPDLL